MSWPKILKEARACHSKQAWDSLTKKYAELISSASSQKPIQDLYKFLSNDSHALNYNEDLWHALLSGCISSWNLNLGKTIAAEAEKIPSAKIRLKVCEVYLESGFPAQSRKIALKSLRMRNIIQNDKLSFQLIICKSYAEEGRASMAKKMINKLETSVETTPLSIETQADIFSNIARTKFFLGNYTGAATLFYEAYQLNKQLKKWEPAASVLFNSAASYDNSGMDYREKAFDLVSKCEHLASSRNLLGPLSHCHAFHATHYLQRGRFTEAADSYRKALKLIPTSEKSFRKLHILSMLTFTLLESGQYKLANLYGSQTLELAEEDESERFKIRYIALRSELDWQNGNIEASLDQLEEAVKSLQTQGINTLEELSAISLYFVKAALLNKTVDTNVKIAKNLKNNHVTWLGLKVALAYQKLLSGEVDEAYELAQHTLVKSKKFDFRYYEAQSLTLILLTKVHRKQWDNEYISLCSEVKKALLGPDFRIFKSQLLLAQASYYYHTGDFSNCKKMIFEAEKLSKLPIHKTEVLNIWTHTINGSAPRLTPMWRQQITIPCTILFFKPSIRKVSNSKYLVSDQYTVSLEAHPILDRLLSFLMTRKNFSATPVELQNEVWKQSTKLQGWQQKIRNSIARLRALFPYTLSPLVVYEGEKVRLSYRTIQIMTEKPETSNEVKIIELMKTGPISSIDLSNEIDISSSTTKRILRKLKTENRIHQHKEGRAILYSIPENVNPS